MFTQRIAAAVCGLCMVASFGAAADNNEGPAFADIRAQQIEFAAAHTREIAVERDVRRESCRRRCSTVVSSRHSRRVARAIVEHQRLVP